MRPPRPGDFRLDGLVQGPIPPAAHSEDRLQEWSQFARGLGIPFELTLDGASFSLLPEEECLRPPNPRELSEVLRQGLEQLLHLYPGGQHGGLLSTLRSHEYRSDMEVQTLYVIAGRGVEARSREVEWQPSEGVETRLWSWRLLAAVGALFAIVALSFAFVDYGAWFRGVQQQYERFDPATFAVDAAPVERYLSVDHVIFDPRTSDLVVTLRRTEDFPRDLDAYRAEKARAEGEEGGLAPLICLERVVVDAALRVHYLDGSGRDLGSFEVEIRGLLEKETVDVRAPMRVHPGWKDLRLQP